METILALAIALLAALFISAPFFLRRGRADGEEYFPDPRAETAKELGSRKDSLLTAIKDIEFDYGLGKLSREDFEELHGKYRAEAAGLLKEMDSMGSGTPADGLDDDIEKEIRAERSKLAFSYDDEELEKEILRAREVSWNDSSARYCPKCGNGSGAEDLFCSKCGAKLDQPTETQNARPL
ncbi:MAG: zinc ribbon domain-containing protein [Candidatus Dadabacteria bacterium]|nr:zinc ribbon domain-containing protein [Candidatus Dadabacteria bacterium]